MSVTTQADADRLLTTRQVSERIGLSTQSVRNLIDAGTLPAVNAGTFRLVNEDDLEPFMPPPGWDHMLTMRQVADHLGIHLRAVYALTQSGVLPVVVHPASPRGGQRVDPDVLARFVRNRR